MLSALTQSKNKNIIITINSHSQVIPKRFECKIIDYSLTLTFNHTQNKISGIQEINVPSSESNYLIDDLYPGYQYGITLTPKTSRGPLLPSPTYFVSPLMTGKHFALFNYKYFRSSTLIFYLKNRKRHYH